MSIATNIQQIVATLPENVTLVAVSKYQTSEATQEAVDAGIHHLGESRVQDLMDKIDRITGDVRWHFIGHLQTNKVKYLIGKVHMIESVDSIRLLKAIEKESAKQNVVTDILIQFNLAQEDSKSGFAKEDYPEIFEHLADYPHVNIRGLMCIGPMTEKTERIREIFIQLAHLYDIINKAYYDGQKKMDCLSMGMTDDYPIAVEAGANIIRIGRKIFNR